MPEIMQEVLPTPTLERYEFEAQLTESLGRKGTPEPGPGLYPRDGTEEVTEVEAALSDFTIPGQELNVVVGSGMAAVGGSVRYLLQRKGRQLGRAPKLAHPYRAYTQSSRTFESLRYMGVRTVAFDPGNPEAIDRLFDEGGADVIALETVANTADSTVAHLRHLFGRLREAGPDGPEASLDNTLALSTGIDFDAILTDEDPVLVAESSTKGPLHNSGHLGVVYGRNEELINGFRKYKATEGLVTSTGVDSLILEALEQTLPRFDERNRALYRSTGILATWLARAQQEQGDNPDIFVSFPELPDHPNHEYARQELTNGVSPVVFIDHPTSYMEEDGARKFFKDITEHPAVREQIEAGQVFLGQSFGFQEATLLYDPNATQVRIAGGYGIDSEKLGKALCEALVDLKRRP